MYHTVFVENKGCVSYLLLYICGEKMWHGGGVPERLTHSLAVRVACFCFALILLLPARPIVAQFPVHASNIIPILSHEPLDVLPPCRLCIFGESCAEKDERDNTNHIQYTLVGYGAWGIYIR